MDKEGNILLDVEYYTSENNFIKVVRPPLFKKIGESVIIDANTTAVS